MLSAPCAAVLQGGELRRGDQPGGGAAQPPGGAVRSLSEGGGLLPGHEGGGLRGRAGGGPSGSGDPGGEGGSDPGIHGRGDPPEDPGDPQGPAYAQGVSSEVCPHGEKTVVRSDAKRRRLMPSAFQRVDKVLSPR